MPPQAIEVRDLTVRYGTRTAVDGLSFAADHGEIVALLGPNGAGKTTTVETLAGYRGADAGTARVAGLDPVTQHRALVQRVGVMPQDGGVYRSIRPDEALALFASYYPDPVAPDELLARVGLADRRRTPWRQLSGGEQQRLSLALALVGRPDVAFLDEPTAGIDPAGRRAIRELVEGLRDDGVCVLLTTHDLEEAERLADRILIVDRGRLLASGTPAELVGDAADGIRFGAPPGLDTAALAARLDAPVREERAGAYHVQTAPSPANVAALTAWLHERDLPLGELRAARHRLEDVFLRLVDEAAPPS